MGSIDTRRGRRDGFRVGVFLVVGLLGAVLLGPAVASGTEKEPGGLEEDSSAGQSSGSDVREQSSAPDAEDSTGSSSEGSESGKPQTESEEPGIRDFFAELVGRSWELRGEWGAGDFHRIKELAWGLDEQIVKVRTFAPDPEGDGWVIQSEGIRAPDASTDGWRFFEFDRGSRILSGSVGRTPESVYYEYDYFVEGELRTVRDAWIRTGEDEYTFQVGTWGDGDWVKILLTARARPVSSAAGIPEKVAD